jgi:hypothetical protein
MCRFLLFSLFCWSRWRLSVGSPGFYVLNSIIKHVAGVELPKEVFTSRARWMTLTIEWNAFTNMFYLLKNILLLILVIFKLKYNNLILKEIMVLNASYVCLHAFSLRRESPDPDPGRWTPYFWGGSITALDIWCIIMWKGFQEVLSTCTQQLGHIGRLSMTITVTSHP